jgi:hypothetical protein
MMTTSALDILPLWSVFATSLAAILLSAEIGHRLGHARHKRAEHEKEPTVGAIVAAELGLLAFLLAFTFSLAASWFQSRRETLLDESNAIGTTFLRAKMLPEPEGSQTRQLLRNYVDARIAAVRDGTVESAIQHSIELQDKLWAAATTVAAKDPRSIPTGLFIQSLNEVIDLHAKRLLVALRSRIPTVVWAVLFAVAILSFGSMGYAGGLTGARRSPAVLAVALIFAAVIWLVIDLDRPQEGLLRVSQQPMIELRASMDEPKS